MTMLDSNHRRQTRIMGLAACVDPGIFDSPFFSSPNSNFPRLLGYNIFHEVGRPNAKS